MSNSTEYHHALEEDANPTGWCTFMSIFQPGVVQRVGAMVPFLLLPVTVLLLTRNQRSCAREK